MTNSRLTAKNGMWVSLEEFSKDLTFLNTLPEGSTFIVGGKLLIKDSQSTSPIEGWAYLKIKAEDIEGSLPITSELQLLLSMVLGRYKTRTSAVMALTSDLNLFKDGESLLIEGLRYVRREESTIIPDMPGWEPLGDWTYEHFGAKSGTNSGAAIASCHSSIDGHTINCPPNSIYLFDPQIPQIWSKPFILKSNGSRYKCIRASTTSYAITITVPVIGDSLCLDTVGSANSQFLERGIDLQAGCDLNLIEVIALNDRSGANSGLYRAINLGPSTGTSVKIRVGSIKTINWDRPVVIQRAEGVDIGRVDITNYRRGLYLLDVKDIHIHGGRIKGITATSMGRAGENGILIEASEDFSTNGVWINNVIVEDSGEHGFRIGGQAIIANVWHTNCLVIRSGLGMAPILNLLATMITVGVDSKCLAQHLKCLDITRIFITLTVRFTKLI